MTLPDCPYKGLAPFGDDDAPLFFGRERDCEVIAANLVASRLTVLYGASGVGKSSILRAGVAHGLRREPGVAVVIASAWADDPTAPLREAERATERAREVYLVLDQFEEYFLYHGDDGPLAEALPELLRRQEAPIHVLVSVREDALSLLDAFKARIPGILANALRLERLDREAARTAILGPLAHWNGLAGAERAVSAEPALVDAVLDQTTVGRAQAGGGRDEIEAPYLQLVLARLWECEAEQGSRTLRLETLAELGGAEAIVRAHLERALGGLAPVEQDVAAAVFNQLVTPSGTKVAHRASDLAGYADVPEPELRPVLDALGRERILRTVDGAGDGSARFEIFHDVLADAVLGWRAQHRLEVERRRAERRHRRLLAVAVAALAALAAVSFVAVYAFVQRGHAQDRARVAEARELEAQALGNLAADPQGSLAGAVRASHLEPGARAESVLRTMLLANRLRDVIQGVRPVAAVAYSPRGTYLLVRDDRAVRLYDAPTRRQVLAIQGRPTAAVFRDDTKLAIGYADGSVLDVAVPTGSRQRLVPPGGGAVTSLSTARRGLVVLATRERGPALVLDPAGARTVGRAATDGALDGLGRLATLVETGAGGHVRAAVYDAETGELLHVLPPAGVEDVAFARKSGLLAVASHDGTTTLWEPRSGRLVETLDDGGKSVDAIAFSHDGELLATASSDGATRVWRVSDGARLFFFVGHTGHGVAVAWSPDDKVVGDASSDGTARLWAVQKLVEEGQLLAVLPGSSAPMASLAFSPAGSAVATGSADGATRIWDGHAEEALHALARHPAPVVAAAYVPGSRLALSIDERGGVQIHDAGSRELVRSYRTPAPVAAAALVGSDRAAFAVGTVVEIRDIRTGRVIRRLPLGAPAVAVAASRDGRLLLTAARRSATLWNLPSATPRMRVAAPEAITAATLSGDGSLLATGGENGSTRVWDAPARRLVRVYSSGSSKAPVTALAFDPAGTRLLVGRGNGDARIWSTRTGRQLHVLVGQFGAIAAAAWSPDGRWAATGGPIAAVLWPTGTGRLLFYLRGHAKQVVSVAFSADGHELLTGSVDGTARTYRCTVCGGLAELQQRAEARLARTAGT